MSHPLQQRAVFNRLFLLAACTFFLLITKPALAGGWTQPKGGSYIKLGLSTAEATEQFKANGKEDLVFARRQHPIGDDAFSLYGEYGLTDRLTLIGFTTFKQVDIETVDFVRQTEGFGDNLLGARFRLWQQAGTVLSSQLMLKIPSDYDPDHSPALGTGDPDVDLKFQAGFSFWPVPAYAGVEAGYRYRSHQWANEIPFFLEAGYTLFNRLMLRVFVDGKQTLGDTAEFNPFLPPESESFIKSGPSLIFKLNPRWEFNLDYAKVIDGENTLAFEEFSLGIALKLQPR